MSDATADDRAESIRMIRDSAAAIAPPGGDTKRARALRFTDLGYDPAILRQMGEMGWIGLRVPEAQGGAGLGMGEACAIAEEMGRGLVPEPLVPAIFSVRVLAASGDTALLPGALAGEIYAPIAWQEKADTLAAPGTSDGARLFIPMARGATHFLVPMREGGRLALRAQDAKGADLTVEKTQDGGHVGTLRPAPGDAIADDIDAVLDAALDEAALMTAAQILGLMEGAFALTLGYLKTRSQFGTIIGTFQALQHRAADLKVQIALTRASVDSAAAVLDAGAVGNARRAAVSRAKSRAAEAGMLVTRQCIQLHGGIGYTDEYDVGLYLRSCMVLSNRFGSAGLHRRRFMATAPEGEE